MPQNHLPVFIALALQICDAGPSTKSSGPGTQYMEGNEVADDYARQAAESAVDAAD